MIFKYSKASIPEFNLKKLIDQFFFNQYLFDAIALQLMIEIIFYFLIGSLFLCFIN
jgi:hypothetical protein